MSGAYAIVVDGQGKLSEHKLGDHAPGQVLETSVEILSNTVVGGKRTVVVRRPLRGRTRDYFTFDATTSSMPILTALGAGAKFAHHKVRAGSSLTFSAVGEGASTCVCQGRGSTLPFGQGVGTIGGIEYSPGCYPAPYTDLIRQKNPSCDVRTYVGGMQCCRHGTILLDADQEVPPHEDEVFFKWRFYHRPWKATDTQVHPFVWYISHARASIEYDATAAAPGTPPEEAVHRITSNFTGADIVKRSRGDLKRAQHGVKLIQAGCHCHSPGCLSLQLFNMDTGKLVCEVTPVVGNGTEAMNEEAYIFLPPCVWGSAEEGLASPPVFQLDTNFTAIKRVNNTVYHYGVMAIFQMHTAYVAPKV